jgi:hypothetical protein
MSDIPIFFSLDDIPHSSLEGFGGKENHCGKISKHLVT